METTWSLNRRVTVRIEQIRVVRSVVAYWRTALSTKGVRGVSTYVLAYIAPAIRLTHTSHTEDQHGIGLGIGHTEDQHSPQAKADQGLSNSGMDTGSGLDCSDPLILSTKIYL